MPAKVLLDVYTSLVLSRRMQVLRDCSLQLMCGPLKRPGICTAESDSLCWVAECFHSHFCWQSYLSFFIQKDAGSTDLFAKRMILVSFFGACCLFSQWFSKRRVKTLDVPIWRPTSRSTQTSPTFRRCLKSKRRTSLKATTWLRRPPTKLLACCRCFAIWQAWIMNRACRCSAGSLQAHGLDSKKVSLLTSHHSTGALSSSPRRQLVESFSAYLTLEDVQKLSDPQHSLLAKIQVLADRCVSVGIVRPLEKSWKPIMAAGIAAGMTMQTHERLHT